MEAVRPAEDAIDAFVRGFREETGYEGEVGHFHFGDSAEMAEELGRLVLEGPKRATAGWVLDEPEPAVEGQHDVVLDGSGRPLCIIRTEEIRTLPFREADPAFAWDEGEGDRTLAWWRDAHVAFFTRRAEHVGEPFTDASEVVLERFSVVWPELQPPGPVMEDGDLVVRPVRPDDRDWVAQVTGETTSADGWPTVRCPALLARHAGRTAGVLAFVPEPARTEVVATAIMEEVGGVEDALRGALEQLQDRYRWGPVEG